MWALEAGVRRFSLRGDKYLDFWVGNLLDHGGIGVRVILRVRISLVPGPLSRMVGTWASESHGWYLGL